MSTFARSEREALADLLLEVGPEAPTLCGDWTTRDLAAHLIIRETRPDAAVGILGGPLAGHTAKVQGAVAARPWGDVVAAVRTGPPRWSPVALGRVDTEMNTVEYFVHHEDVRRAAATWEPRELTDAEVAQLWPRTKRMGSLVTRRSPVGVVIVPTDGPDAGQTIRVKAGVPEVVLTGPTSELALALFGRRQVRVEVNGTAADVERFYSFPR